jgi:hypothetical protein
MAPQGLKKGNIVILNHSRKRWQNVSIEGVTARSCGVCRQEDGGV